MNLFELMDSKVSSFSKNDRAIYEGIRKFPDRFAYDSITELSDHAGFTKSALTRFAQKLGFAGFVEFQYQFQQDIRTYQDAEKKESHADIYARVLKQTAETVSEETVGNLVERMEKAEHVYILGSNLSRLPAEELLIATHFNSRISAQKPAPDLMPHRFSRNDMIIIYSALSGVSHQDMLRSIRKTEDGKPYLVLITTNGKHSLRHNFDEVIVLPTASLTDSTGKTILSDTFAFLMFNDIVTSYMGKE